MRSWYSFRRTDGRTNTYHSHGINCCDSFIKLSIFFDCYITPFVSWPSCSQRTWRLRPEELLYSGLATTPTNFDGSVENTHETICDRSSKDWMPKNEEMNNVASGNLFCSAISSPLLYRRDGDGAGLVRISDCNLERRLLERAETILAGFGDSP